MRYDEPLVGSLAVVFAILAVCIAIGPWQQPYQLRTIAAVKRRFGKLTARGVWVAIALALFTAGMAILSGVRPSYAVPATQTDLKH